MQTVGVIAKSILGWEGEDSLMSTGTGYTQETGGDRSQKPPVLAFGQHAMQVTDFARLKKTPSAPTQLPTVQSVIAPFHCQPGSLLWLRY